MATRGRRRVFGFVSRASARARPWIVGGLVGAVVACAGVVGATLYVGPRKTARWLLSLVRPAVRLTIPEGRTRFDIARQAGELRVCSEASFLAAASDEAFVRSLGVPASTAEGYLFPDTYDFERDIEGREVVARMVGNFFARTADMLSIRDARLSVGDRPMSAHEIVTLASLIEREAALPSERAVIAGVFINRLTLPSFPSRLLQTDPSAAYGCRAARSPLASCAGFDGRRITRTMLADRANPYNTYAHPGLPPGPIASPGLASLRAALMPARHDYLYFVARGGRAHTFSRTLEEHEAAVRRARAAQKLREQAERATWPGSSYTRSTPD